SEWTQPRLRQERRHAGLRGGAGRRSGLVPEPDHRRGLQRIWNVVFQTPVIRGAFLFTPKFTYAPDLITHYKFQKNPQRITYYLRKNAKWSDGVQVSGKDWIFTWKTAVNPKYKD